MSEGWLTPADLLCVLDDTYTFDVMVDAEAQLRAARWAGGGSDAAPWLHGGGGGDKGGGGGTAAVDAQTSFQNGLAIGTLFALLAAACLRALMILRHRKRMARLGVPVKTSARIWSWACDLITGELGHASSRKGRCVSDL